MFKINIEQKTQSNKNYRKVLHTTSDLQLVVMSLDQGEEIGEEVHEVTQFIRVESGNGKAIVDGKTFFLKDGISLIISPGTTHNVIAGKNGLKLYTIYSPPQHPPGTVEKYKID